MATKVCPGCGVPKDLETEYAVSRREKSGRQSRCRECMTAQSKAWRSRHPTATADYNRQKRRNDPEAYAAYMKAWRTANHEKVLQQNRASKERYREAINERRRAAYAANPEKYRRSSREWAAAHPDKIREHRQAHLAAHNAAALRSYHKRAEAVKPQMRAYYRSNSDHLSAQARRWSAEHPEQRRGTQRAYGRTHPNFARAKHALRRARERAAEGRFTNQDIVDLLERQHGLCAYCDQPLNGIYHIDHDVPLARGGSNHMANLFLAHPSCNNRKYTKTGAEYRASLGLPPLAP